MSEARELLAEPVLILRPGGGRMMESAFELTDGGTRTLATGREPGLTAFGQARRLTSKTWRNFPRTVEFSAPGGGPRLFTVEKKRYAYMRRTSVSDGYGQHVGQIDDQSPSMSTRYRLLGADEQELGRIEGSRGELSVTDASGAEQGRISWERPTWRLRSDGSLPFPDGLLVVAGLVLASLTKGYY